MFLAKVHVRYKNGVLDPQASAIKVTLENSGYEYVKELQTGKYFELHIDTSDETRAKAQVKELCEKVLANPVIEDFEFDLLEV